MRMALHQSPPGHVLLANDLPTVSSLHPLWDAKQATIAQASTHALEKVFTCTANSLCLMVLAQPADTSVRHRFHRANDAAVGAEQLLHCLLHKPARFGATRAPVATRGQGLAG
ncbi:hypothetical protein PMIN01_00988 [Paraphaeosphaeria minitans]|uniref:Uncharacterized protein n=1 Tax=Paraphaeosphaeria minitans TaxID=565426 RepID=A0A9P6GTU3_9PLEO|nr:hypothetical protein PMIN01_00988 [Paraphaeosphaeria minitans]